MKIAGSFFIEADMLVSQFNAKFRIIKHGNTRMPIDVDPTISDADLASSLLTSINVDDAVNFDTHPKLNLQGEASQRKWII